LGTIVAGQRPVDLTRQETLAYDFTFALVNGGVLPELIYKAAVEQFGVHGAAELSYWALLHGFCDLEHLRCSGAGLASGRCVIGDRICTSVTDGIVNDEVVESWGKAAIRARAERDIIGERLTIAATEVAKHYDNFIVTADIDGKFYKRGLPDALVLAVYFTPHNDLII
jgi:hypothetical protein